MMSEDGPPGQDIPKKGPAPRGPAAPSEAAWPQIDGVEDFCFGIGPRDGRLYKWGLDNQPAPCVGADFGRDRIVSIGVCGDYVTQYVVIVNTAGRAYRLVFSNDSTVVDLQSDLLVPPIIGVALSKGSWGVLLGIDGRPHRFEIFRPLAVLIADIENVEMVDVQQNEAVFLQRDGTVSAKYHNGRGEFIEMAPGFSPCHTISAGYEKVSGAVTHDDRAILFTGRSDVRPPRHDFVAENVRSISIGEYHMVLLHLNGSVSVIGKMSTFNLLPRIRDRLRDRAMLPPEGAPHQGAELHNFTRVENLLPRHNIMQVAIVEDRTYFLQFNGEILVGENGIAIAFYDEDDFQTIRLE
jgi:hypothetical protein